MSILLYRDLQSRGLPWTRDHVRKLVAEGKFPKPFRLTDGGRLAWTSVAIDNYLAERMAAAEVQQSPAPSRGRR